MSYNIVLTTAEDIVAVIDAIYAKNGDASIEYIQNFTGIATEDQVEKAIMMAEQFDMICCDEIKNLYSVKSTLAELLVTAFDDNQKAVIMRIILEQYKPYRELRKRYRFTKSIDMAVAQIKAMLSISANERDIKNTLISIGTYSKSLRSEGANLYSFIEEENNISVIDDLLSKKMVLSSSLETYFGERVLTIISQENVLTQLQTALLKTENGNIDSRAVVVYAANAFESFLVDFANLKNISLTGKTGIIQKADAMSTVLSKKHRGIINYVGQIRNAADHGSDPDDDGNIWYINNETAIMYPHTIAVLIKSILDRDNGINTL